MKIASLILCAIGLLAAVPWAHSQTPVKAARGFKTGNEYRGMPDIAKSAYLTGWADGMVASPLLNPSVYPSWVSRCLHSGMPTDRFVVIVDRYLDEHPERWDEDMVVLVYSALAPGCDERQLGPKNAIIG